MITVPLPLVADNVEGVGRVDETLLDAAYLNVMYSSQRQIYRLDRAAGSLNIIDDATAATSGNAWRPFGANVLPLAATVRVFDSTDGVWATNELTVVAASATGTIHASVADCLRATGWCRLTFGENTNRVTWRPSQDPAANIPARRYIRVELDDGADKDSWIFACGASDLIEVLFDVRVAGSPTVPVEIANVTLARKAADVKWIDNTAQANGSTTASYTPPAATFLPLVGATVMYGTANPANAFEEYIFLNTEVGTTWAVEVSGTGDTWIAVGDYVSGSSFYTAAPSSLQAVATHYTSTFTPPAAWVRRTLGDLANEAGGTITTPSLYWLRYRATAVADRNPKRVSVSRSRVRQFGAANTSGGIQFPAAVTVRSASILLRGARTGTAARTMQLNDLIAGASRALTIPAGTAPGDTVLVDFDNIASQRFGIGVVPGGAQFTDVLLLLEEG